MQNQSLSMAYKLMSDQLFACTREVAHPFKDLLVKILIRSPVENTKYFLLSGLYQIAGSRTTMLPIGD